ncbi:uncharacterized protein LOC121053624 [Oryza brachyantha]|uniref:uncharacterized protein LOC121053624 n=1 Tax=Oryza brachyantha TaxID=4533 RepID=UPI001AD99104|nr:uncharacterized protein LOC121053624 [Oryza brachyantha]
MAPRASSVRRAVAVVVVALVVVCAMAPACEGARVMREVVVEAGAGAGDADARGGQTAVTAAATSGGGGGKKMSSYQPMRWPPVPPSGPSHNHNKRKAWKTKRVPLPPSGHH